MENFAENWADRWVFAYSRPSDTEFKGRRHSVAISGEAQPNFTLFALYKLRYEYLRYDTGINTCKRKSCDHNTVVITRITLIEYN